MPSMSLPGWPKFEINTDSWSPASSSWSGVYWACVAADKFLAVACSSSIYLVELDTGKYKQLNNDSSWSVSGMGWSGKLGKLIIASSYTYAIYAMDIQTGAYEKITDDSWTDVRAMAVKGEKAWIACTDGNLYKFDLDDKDVKTLEKGTGNFGNTINLWFKGDKLHVLFPTCISKVDDSDGSTSKVCDVSGADDACVT
jgi:Tol biopolymer transport system component